MDKITRISRRYGPWLETLRTGMWTIPLGMMLFAVALYATTIRIDAVVSDDAMMRTWWLHSGSGDDARNLLSTLVTAIITMSSVVFSITTVALTLAAAQFGSRLVRTYMADRRTKAALGLFAMTTLYCLLALRAVEKDMPAADVPHVTVTAGLILGLLCVLALLFFLHVVARSIVADEVIRRVTAELEQSIDSMPALQPGDHRPSHGSGRWPDESGERSALLRAARDGYVETIHYEGLAAFAREHDVLVRIDARAGAFLSRNGWLGAIYPAEAATPAVVRGIQDAIVIGAQRTPTQDLEFSIRHVTDIALRALSPSMNDSNTALVVIDHLTGALSRLMSRQFPGTAHRDETGKVRVIAKGNNHAGVLDAALHQIRQAAAPQPAVIINLLGALGRIGEHLVLQEQYEALMRHTRLAAAAGLRETSEPSDRADIENARGATLRKLEDARITRLEREPAPAYAAVTHHARAPRARPHTGVLAGGDNR